MEYTISNRYGDIFTIKKEHKKIILEGITYYRTLSNVETDVIEAIDPSGGPFMGIGDDLQYLNSDFNGIILDSIEIEENKIVLNTK